MTHCEMHLRNMNYRHLQVTPGFPNIVQYKVTFGLSIHLNLYVTSGLPDVVQCKMTCGLRFHLILYLTYGLSNDVQYLLISGLSIYIHLYVTSGLSNVVQYNVTSGIRIKLYLTFDFPNNVQYKVFPCHLPNVDWRYYYCIHEGPQYSTSGDPLCPNVYALWKVSSANLYLSVCLHWPPY